MLNNIYRDRLPSQGQYAYNMILTALLNQESECSIYGVALNDVEKAREAVILENPDIINYPGLDYNVVTGNNVARVNLEYIQVDSELFTRKIDYLTRKITEKARNASEYIKCKTIFDILTSSIEYQQAKYTQYLNLVRANSAELSQFLLNNINIFTAYGAAVNGKAVCQGISKLFKILCNRFNIECACVEAAMKIRGNCEGIAHMLNIVEIDGEKAYVDVTNSLIHKDVPVLRYDYFLVPSRIIDKRFEIKSVVGPCEDENINYYARNGLIFKTLFSLRKYLVSYIATHNNYEVRLRYDGANMEDSELEKLCLEILNMQCESGKFVKLIVDNGCCTAKIFDNTEA